MGVLRNLAAGETTLTSCNFTMTVNAHKWTHYVIRNDGTMTMSNTIVSPEGDSNRAFGWITDANVNEKMLYNIHNSNIGQLYYVLPAPMGHYLSGIFECRAIMCVVDGQNVPCESQLCDWATYSGRSLAIVPQNTYASGTHAFPSPCAAGTVGGVLDANSQSSRFCADACPAGEVLTCSSAP